MFSPSLLRRMLYLEELTLYLHILGGSAFISGTHLNNEIPSHMPRLRIFSFYFAFENAIANSAIRIFNEGIERTFTNIEHRPMACLIDYRDFPFLKRLSIDTILAPNWRTHEYHRYHIDWCSIVEYSHLISLDTDSANSYYVEHFLNKTKAHLSCLTELNIRYEDLHMMTEKFIRNEI